MICQKQYSTATLNKNEKINRILELYIWKQKFIYEQLVKCTEYCW